MRLRIATIVLMIATVVAGVFVGDGLFRDGSGGGWSHESGEAWSAENALRVLLDRGRPNVVVIVRGMGETVDSPAVTAAAADVQQQLADLAVFEAESYWSLGRPEFMRSEDGTAGLIFGRIPGASEDLADRAAALSKRLRWDRDVIAVTVGGDVMTHLDIRNGSTAALSPVLVATLLALLVAAAALRSLRSFAMVAAGTAIAGAAAVMAVTGLGMLIEVPALAKVLSLAVAMGLTAANSYLLIVRYTEERDAGAGKQAAIFATITTAGRVVAVVSAVAVAIGFTLVALPTALLRATGLAVVLTAFISGVVSVLVVGLLLSMFATAGPRAIEDPIRPITFGRLTRLIDGRPLVTLVLGAAVLLPLANMGVGVRAVEPGPETLTNAASSRRVAQIIDAEFPSNDADAAFVLPQNLPETLRSDALTRQYIDGVSSVPGVARVDTSRGTVVDGESVRVPGGFSERYVRDTANYMLAPLEVNARSRAAEAAVLEIGAIDAPFRTNIGGATARQLETVSAVSGRALFAYGVALAFVLVLVAGLLRSPRAGVRATLMAFMVGAVTGAVIKIGFADGRLADLLGFTSNGTVSVVAGPIAWTVGGIVASALVVIGWGAVRERVDACGTTLATLRRGLRGTALPHTTALLLLTLPLAALSMADWRTAQLAGAAAAVTGLVAIVIGRFVLLPAFVAFRPAALWPVQADGEVRRVFPTTTASARWAQQQPPPVVAAAAVEEVADQDVPAVEVPAVAAPGAGDEPVSEQAPSAFTDAADASAEAVTVGETGGDAAPDADRHRAPELVEVLDDTSAPASEAVTDVPEPPDVDDAEVIDLEPAAVIERPQSIEDSEAAADTPEVTDAAATETDEATGVVARDQAPDTEPDEVDAAVEDGVDAEAQTAPGGETPADGGTAGDSEGAGDVETAAEVEDPTVVEAEPTVADEAPGEAAGVTEDEVATGDRPPELHVAPANEGSEYLVDEAPLPTVDVVSLTQSVIASLEAELDFTTEIGSGFVANPSNNLSRVMEAILRDASSRGGEEVLVYGHASRDRYRWMVVDSGPHAEHDPDRARTLAEAQRFIRRVGGVVECRPQGDFTVFVVEIPMAS